MLIGKIDVRPKQKILVTIREEKKVKMIDVRVHNTSEDGEMVPSPAGISLSEEQVDQAIELLKEAKVRVAGQKQERDDSIKGGVATRDTTPRKGHDALRKEIRFDNFNPKENA